MCQPKHNCISVRKVIKNEFEEYRNETFKLNKENIFWNAFEIYAKQEILGFFENSDCLSESEYKTLLRVNNESNNNLLDILFDYFLEDEFASLTNDDDITEWIKRFCEKEMERVQ